MITAKQSPRFENNCLYWYEGNTWKILFKLDPKQNGEPFVPETTDFITLTFKKNDVSTPIHTFTFTGLQSLEMTLEMTAEVTKLLPKGEYVFGITYHGEHVTTICDKHAVRVESCVA